ncbi:MAG: DUF1573 domain-containing protein [Saprospiraceae bacterium]|nr:DUF1573 domain-containing protein [Saprospiraceae bacterium]
MKKILTSIMMITFVCVGLYSQSGPKIRFESNDMNFGTIEQNSEPFRSLKFTNVGNEPLIVKSARGNCGCTVPTWPREAIMPGESSELKIKYSTERVGPINKKVTITTNEQEGSNTHILSVVGNVLGAQDTQGVPENKGSILAPKK